MLPPHSFKMPQGQGGPATRELSSSMGISRERSLIPTESHKRIDPPSDHVEHNHPFSSPSLSRQPSTNTHPYSGISTGSRAELNRLGSMRPEGPRGGEQAEQQGDGISRETRAFAVGYDVPSDTQPLQQGVADAVTVSRASVQYLCLCSILRAVCHSPSMIQITHQAMTSRPQNSPVRVRLFPHNPHQCSQTWN